MVRLVLAFPILHLLQRHAGYTPTASSLQSSPRDGVVLCVPIGGQRIPLPHYKVSKDPRRYEIQDLVEETYGPCIKFYKCRNVGVLGNGLCVDCWDRNNIKNKDEDETL